MKIGRWKKLRILASVLAAGSIYFTGSLAFADDIALQAGTPDATGYVLINTGTNSWDDAWKYAEDAFAEAGIYDWYDRYTVIEVEDEATETLYYYIAAGTTTRGTEGNYSTYVADSYVTATGTSDTGSSSGFRITEVYLNPAHENDVLENYYISSGVKEQVGTQDTLNGKTLGTVNFDSVIAASNVDGGVIANHTKAGNGYDYLIDANGDGNYTLNVGKEDGGVYGSGYWAYYDETGATEGGLTYNEDAGHFYYNGTLVEGKYIYSIADSSGKYHLGVFLDDNGDIYTSTVYGLNGEIFSTNISITTDATTGQNRTIYTSFWGETIDTLDVTLAESDLTVGDLQSMFDVTYANDQKLHEDDLRNIELSSTGDNTGTIALQTNGTEDDTGGAYIPGTITITGIEGTGGDQDAKLTFSNSYEVNVLDETTGETSTETVTSSFDITTGSTVRANDYLSADVTESGEALKKISVNGIAYDVYDYETGDKNIIVSDADEDNERTISLNKDITLGTTGSADTAGSITVNTGEGMISIGGETSTIGGLSNTEWSPEYEITTGQAATEDQLGAMYTDVEGDITTAAAEATTEVRAGSSGNISVDGTIDSDDDHNIYTVDLSNTVTLGTEDEAGSLKVQDTSGNLTEITGTGITTGSVTIDGTSGTIGGLTNTEWSPEYEITTGQAATEDQLGAMYKDVEGDITTAAEAATTEVRSGSSGNISVTGTTDPDDEHNIYTVDLNKDIILGTIGSDTAGSITVNTGEGTITIGGATSTIGGLSNTYWGPDYEITSGQAATEDQLGAMYTDVEGDITTAAEAATTEVRAGSSGNISVDGTIDPEDEHNIYTVDLSNTVTLGTEEEAGSLTVQDTLGSSTEITGTGITTGGITIDGTTNTITSGIVTIDGTSGTIGGLTNTEWSPEYEITTGQAATEDQLGAMYTEVEGDITTAAEAATTEVIAGSDNISVTGTIDPDDEHNIYTVDLNKDIILGTIGSETAGSITVNTGEGTISIGGETSTIGGLSNTYWGSDYVITSGQAATEDQLGAVWNLVEEVELEAKTDDYRLIDGSTVNRSYSGYSGALDSNNNYTVGDDGNVTLVVQGSIYDIDTDTTSYEYTDVVISNVAKATDVEDLYEKIGDMDWSNFTYVGGDTTNITDALYQLDQAITQTSSTTITGGSINADGTISLVDAAGDTISLTGQLSDSIADTLELTSDTDTGDGTLTLTSHDKYTGEETAVASVSGIATTENVKNITGVSTNTELKEKYENTTYIKGADSLADADVLLDQAIRDTNASVQNIGNQVSRLGTRINRVGAGAAALAALHPMDFDPDDKWSFAGGYGNYRNAHAAAVGAFYRPDEKVMVSMASTVGNDNNMVSVGASFALDRVNHVNNSKVAMAKEIVELRTQLAELSAMVAKMARGGLVMDEMKLFPDVPENHWAYEYIGKLCAAGIIEGYPDGNFSGDRLMTRYEFAAMLYRALQKGAMLDGRIIKEFEPELCRIHVDRVHGEDESRHKIDRVRVTDVKDEETGRHATDHYGTKIYPNITVEPAKEK